MKRMRLTEARTRAGGFSPKLAWFGLFVTIGGVLAARFGDVGPWPVIAVICTGWMLSAIALLLAITGLVVVWRQGLRGATAAMHGFVISCLALAWPAILAAQIWRSPDQTDLSTDTFSPPAFATTARAAAGRSGFIPPPAPPVQRAAADQARLMALPLFLDQQPADALKAAETAARSLGWTLTDTVDAPDGGGQFEAVARSDLLRFPQYVAVRVRPTADGAQLDVRVVSVFGRYSPGSGVQRILDLHEAVQAVDEG